MKVVINRCFGGFGISNKAFELLLQRKGIEFQQVTANFPYGQDVFLYYHKGHAGNNEHQLLDYDFCNNRSDVDLVAVVEELGEEANGWAAELAVVEIPDDVKWHIHEYDGLEHVAENHRTWR